MSAAPTPLLFELSYVPLGLAGGLCVLGLIFFTIGRLRTSMSKGWVKTTGMIVNKDGTTDGLLSPHPTFTWTGTDGRVYRRTSMVQSGFYRLGSQVPVLFHPQQQQRALIDTFGQKLVIFTVIGALMIGLGLFTLAIAGYLLMNR